jgi:serine/threonine protein kinase
MATDPDTLIDTERTLCEALAAYFDAQQAGEAPEREVWLRRYPDLADQLAAFLKQEDFLLSITAPLRSAAAEVAGSRLPRPRDPYAGPRSALCEPSDYEILGEVARGGMAIVYRARQRSLNRPVALKMLQVGSLAGDDDLRRFRLEAEAVAHLDHPNIVSIYDVGEHDGTSYLAMKLIEGSSLARCLPEYLAHPGKAVALMATVARAVHHAHQRGILHRDLKPSNILIDTLGQPHITDFGLAKRVDGDPALTLSGVILGTPAYMAPEQAEGRSKAITIATDIHGLGAVFYAVLTGSPAFQGGSILETLDRVRRDLPEPPSSLSRHVDCDLDTICLKSLAKEPERRYSSALALAEDLERWMRNEPILARPARPLERAWRWCRRNPSRAGLCVAVLTLLAGSIAAMWISNRILAREQSRTAANLLLAREAIEEHLSKVSESRLLGQPGLEPLRRELLETALKYYQNLARQHATDRSLQHDLGRAHLRVAGIRRLLGERSFALEAYGNALEIFRALAATDQDDERAQSALAETYNLVGQTHGEVGDVAVALRYIQQSVTFAERSACLKPDDVLCQNSLAGYYFNVGIAERRAGDHPASERSLRQSALIRTQIVAQYPLDVRLRRDLAATLAALANLLSVSGRLAEAHIVSRGVVECFEAVAAAPGASDDDRSEVARCKVDVGNIERWCGRPREAHESFRSAVGILEALVKVNPTNFHYQQLLAVACACVARADGLGPECQRAEIDECKRAGRRAIELNRALVQAAPQVPSHQAQIVGSCVNLANFFHEKLGDHKQALACLEEAVEAGEPLLKTRAGLILAGERMSCAYLAQGEQLLASGDSTRARTSFEQCRDLLTRLIAETPRVPVHRDRLATALRHLSKLDLESGHLDAAEIGARRALTLTGQIIDENPDLASLPPKMTLLARFGSIQRDLARALEARGRMTEALALYEQASSTLGEAVQRQPADRFAVTWLAEARQARENLRVRLDTLALTRGPAMPQGLDAFATDPACAHGRYRHSAR